VAEKEAERSPLQSVYPVCLLSQTICLALGLVWTVCSITKLTGLFSLTIVSVPSTCELYVSFVFGLKIAASTPAPIGRASMIFPSPAWGIIIVWGFAAGSEEASTGEIVVGGNRGHICVYDSDVAPVSDIAVNMAIVVANSLLRHPAKVDGAHHGPIRRVDHFRIGRNVAENIDPGGPMLGSETKAEGHIRCQQLSNSSDAVARERLPASSGDRHGLTRLVKGIRDRGNSQASIAFVFAIYLDTNYRLGDSSLFPVVAGRYGAGHLSYAFDDLDDDVVPHMIW
jgi:hypothetical protein